MNQGKMDCIDFVKMHGAGNDYVYLDGIHNEYDNLPELARRISDRHFGVGSDGLVVIMPSDVSDFRMRMFNADGSEAQICGNASRCIGKYVYERGLTDKRNITLETLSGEKHLHLHVVGGVVDTVTVDMGLAVVSETHEIKIGEKTYHAVDVNVGNPHGVIFTDDLSDEAVLVDGPVLEIADCWPERANIEFVRLSGNDKAEMRVWERGSGETLACGTGACAVTAAAYSRGLSGKSLELKLRGGTLFVEIDTATRRLLLTGGAEFIADGRYYYLL